MRLSRSFGFAIPLTYHAKALNFTVLYGHRFFYIPFTMKSELCSDEFHTALFGLTLHGGWNRFAVKSVKPRFTGFGTPAELIALRQIYVARRPPERIRPRFYRGTPGLPHISRRFWITEKHIFLKKIITKPDCLSCCCAVRAFLWACVRFPRAARRCLLWRKWL